LRAVLGWHAHALDLELAELAARRPGVLHAPTPELTSGLFAADGFHPNARAYARWAQHIADVVTQSSTQAARKTTSLRNSTPGAGS
jgi:lysophospholipase L1-like esterase